MSEPKTIDREGKVVFLIITSFNKAEQVTSYYKQRWQIETLFRVLRTSRSNIQDIYITDLKRLEKLFLLTMVAFVWCYKIGDYLDINIRKIKNMKEEILAYLNMV